MSKDKNKKFDYIVIGAGTAGGVIAKELTDHKKTSVLVLEAGTNMENSSPSIVEADLRANDNKLSFNMLSKTEDMIARQMRLRNGRVIGGGSQHNFMAAVRGSRELYDEWARLVGEVWKYDNIRSLFIKNETYTGDTQRPDERGTTGPIFIRQQIIPNAGLIQTLTEAASKVLGIPIKKDYNTGIRDVAFLKTQLTQKLAGTMFERSSTATGYLNENIVTQGNEFQSDEYGVAGRKLVILAKTTVNKILFKQEKGLQVAKGVEFVRNGVTEKAFAKKGVIVSAGIFSSVILQRSGVGRAEDLRQAGIKPLIESPQVGHNFQTQFYVPMGVEVETTRLLQVLNADPIPTVIGAFRNVDDGPGRRLQLIGLPVSALLPVQEIFTNRWQFNPNQTSNVMSIAIADLNPKSRGTILAAHSDPEAYPSIELNPLENLDDLNYIIDQYIETFKIMQKAQELDKAGIYRVVYPPEDIFKMDDEAKKRGLLADYVRASYTNFDHFGGQCKMGTGIQNGVVDQYLNVFGTKNLKVADLSVAPILPDGNTSIPAQMIGLNAVRFIKNDCHSVDSNEDESSEEFEESS